LREFRFVTESLIPVPVKLATRDGQESGRFPPLGIFAGGSKMRIVALAIVFAGSLTAAAPSIAATYPNLYPSLDLPISAKPATLSVNFTVDVDGVKNVFPAQLTLHKGQLSGTIDAFGAQVTVDAGSTDKKSQLNLQATIPHETSFTLVGTLKFKAGTGGGVFTDGDVQGTYTAKKP